MKPILYETSPGALDALLISNVFVSADLYTYTLAGGGVMRYTTADFDIAFSGSTYSSRGTFHDAGRDSKGTGKAVAHWKVGLDVDTWTYLVTPRKYDAVLGTSYPDTLGSQPFLSACRAGQLDGAIVRVDRAYADGWPTSPELWGGKGFAPVGVLTIFLGRVANLSMDQLEVQVQLNDMRELLTMAMPRNLFQAPCRHVLFGPGCTLTASSFRTSLSVTSGTTRNSINAFASAPSGSGTYNLGKVQFTSGQNAGMWRHIREWQAGAPSNFKLIGPVPYDFVIGDTFDAYPGCNKTLGACGMFGNTVNFGGEPFIPQPETAV